jgi:hypothetical protein
MTKRLPALLFLTIFASTLVGLGTLATDAPAVSKPPDSFFQFVSERDREPAREFYQKYIDVEGMPVAASATVADEALQRTHWLVTHLLAGRPDVLQAMVSNRMYLIVIGKDQVYTDMPEYAHAPNPEYLNERVRGTGGHPTSFGEENLLSLPLDRYDDESIALHEFCHTIDGTLRKIDPTWTERRNKTYHHSIEKGIWKNTYAASNPGEFWAEICQSYFDCNRTNNWNHGPIGKREELKAYDPESYELVQSTFNLSGANDFRYIWMRKLPNVIAPPAKFHIDPYYTKFTWAREFHVVGHDANDDSLLRVNEIIRKMFAYRHDILKALMADGWRMAVVAPGEKIPRDEKIMVVEAGKDRDVILTFAKKFYEVTGNRPVDPNWDKRGRDVQQYELRVKRLDEEFGKRVRTIHDRQKTPLGTGEFWAEGVVKYFTDEREKFAADDQDLYHLVEETMAYAGHSDWRLAR